MDRVEQSIARQKREGTYERNQFIRKIYKPGDGGKIGRAVGISRQAVHVIIQREDKNV